MKTKIQHLSGAIANIALLLTMSACGGGNNADNVPVSTLPKIGQLAAEYLPNTNSAKAHDVSPVLRDIKLSQAQLAAARPSKEARIWRQIPPPPPEKFINGPALSPPRMQEQSAGIPFPASVFNDILGLGIEFPGFSMRYIPPDTSGAVGLTQYVQWVNSSFAVFDKLSGNSVYGPVDGNTLWTGFGGPCETNNDGDPLVVYDKAADRWVLSQFTLQGGPPYFQCVAVSTTADATGSYNRYAFAYDEFPDYPKMGVWPDAYYITFNMFTPPSFGFNGAKVCAYDRASMIAGLDASQQCVQLGTDVASLLPADLDGLIPPPLDAPNPLVNIGLSSSLNLFKFHVDWVDPTASLLSGPTVISVDPFTRPPFQNSVPQQGTIQRLDSIGDRLMFRLAYRNFADHESLTVNHSVIADPSTMRTGVRWYELRDTNSSPKVYQQSTFSPDSSSRWVGSVAMDATGNIAMGYNVSSGNMFPSIRYTGRLADDPLNIMRDEAVDINGTVYGSGSQTLYSRWGDYSSMTVDPVDDCTFWYTNQYLPASGNFNWNTRIFSFRLPTCSSPSAPS